MPLVMFGTRKGQHVGCSIMVWACCTSHCTGAVHIIDWRMDGAMYRQILEKSHPECEAFIEDAQDNDPKHTANLTRDWFNTRKINVLQWPRQSLDLNPILESLGNGEK